MAMFRQEFEALSLPKLKLLINEQLATILKASTKLKPPSFLINQMHVKERVAVTNDLSALRSCFLGLANLILYWDGNKCCHGLFEPCQSAIVTQKLRGAIKELPSLPENNAVLKP